MANPQIVIELVSSGRQQVQAEIGALRREAGPAGASQRALQRETTAASRASAQQAREVASAQRQLLTLRSTLGGVERAESQATTAQNRLNAAVRAGLTDNGREFCGTERHPYELYLALNEIEHRTTKVGSPRTNGFVERLKRHRAGGVLPPGHAPEALRDRGRAADRPGRLVGPLQPRTAAPRPPQTRAAGMGRST